MNAVSPGIIKTPMHAPETHDFLAEAASGRRMGEIRDIVDAVLLPGKRRLRHRRDPACRWRPERRSLTGYRATREERNAHADRHHPGHPRRHDARRATSVTAEEKAALITGVSQLLLDVLNKPLDSTFVVIEEVELDNWGWGGLPVPEYRKKLAQARAASSA